MTIISYGTLRSSSFEDEEFQKGVHAFRVGQYRESIRYFEELAASKPEDRNRCMYAIACSYLFLSDYSESAKLFKEYVAENNFRIMTEHAEWGIILSKLGDNRIDEEFRRHLKDKMLDVESVFHRYSLQLEKDLNSVWRKF